LGHSVIPIALSGIGGVQTSRNGCRNAHLDNLCLNALSGIGGVQTFYVSVPRMVHALIRS